MRGAGARWGGEALSIRHSVGVLIFNFIFAKNVSALVVVFKLEQSYVVSLRGRNGCSVSAFHYQTRRK